MNILIEGNDDKRFFSAIIKPLIESDYRKIRIIRYSQDSKKKRKNLLKSFNEMKNIEYIFVTDIDNNKCVILRKEQVIKEMDDLVSQDKIIVIKKEIESWYMAGLDKGISEKYGINILKSTENFSKEDFKKIIPKKKSRILFMQEILEKYCCDVAKNRNGSIKYFLDRWCN
ncbi:MAG: hypothetical protein IBV52_08025 [Candidatus Bathyarchaeota archaeon]